MDRQSAAETPTSGAKDSWWRDLHLLRGLGMLLLLVIVALLIYFGRGPSSETEPGRIAEDATYEPS